MGKLYKGRHWVAQGGFHFIQRTKNHREILTGKAAERLFNVLEEIFKEFQMQDVTIKMFPSHFHLFYFCHKYAPAVIIGTILEKTAKVLKDELDLENVWDEEYYFSGIDDLSAEYIETYLRNLGLA